MSYKCPNCGTDTVYQMFSGGEEFYCPGCETQGRYPEDGEGLPRATLLRTPEGVTALRAQMDQELARRRDVAQEGERAAIRIRSEGTG